MRFRDIFYQIFFKPILLILHGLSSPFVLIRGLLHKPSLDVEPILIEYDEGTELENIFEPVERTYPVPGYAGSRNELGSDRTGSFQRDYSSPILIRNRIVSPPSELHIDVKASKNNEFKVTPPSPSALEYHAINIPLIIRQRDRIDVSSLVFKNKIRALKEMKKFKDARFKSFKTLAEAELFINTNLAIPLDESAILKFTGLPEKGNYRTTRTVELLKMRELIETGQTKQFKLLITANPFYLVSSGDTPPLLHVGARYNAFHIAAKMNKPEMIKIILDIIQEPSFFCKLYGINDDTVLERTERLIDFYLNTPDKVSCETPLHFACKGGYKNVIEILVNHPLTKVNLKNKFDKTPLELVPESMSQSSRKQIERYFEERCYVPLYRDEDNMSPPRVGTPCSPIFNCDVLSPPFSQVPLNNSPEGSPLSARMLPSVVKAYAGPMSPEEASEFRRNWKPSRDKETLDDIRADLDKGYERLGRQLAQKHKFGWREYWDFLGVYTDISKPEGLEKLEAHLQTQFLTSNVHTSLESLYVTENITTPKTVESIKSLKNMLTTDSNKNISGFSQSLMSNESGSQEPLVNQTKETDPEQSDSDKEEDETTKESQFNKKINSFKHFRRLKKAPVVKDFNETMDLLAKEFGAKLYIVGSSQEAENSPSSNMFTITSNSENIDTKDDHHHSVYTSLTSFNDVYNTLQKNQPITVSVSKSPSPATSPVKESASPGDMVTLNISSPTGLNVDIQAKPARTPPKTKCASSVYLNGFEPSKLDLDVYRCLKDVDIDSRTYPYIHRWLNKVKSFSADEQLCWQSPAKCVCPQKESSPQSPSSVKIAPIYSSIRKTLFGSPGH
ncbi:ankyrin repeat and LEM domain-containing protein 2-like [Argonauta hians]